MRLAAGLSIREMERRTALNRGRLSILERGVTPTDDEAARILAALRDAAPVVAPAPEGSFLQPSDADASAGRRSGGESAR